MQSLLDPRRSDRSTESVSESWGSLWRCTQIRQGVLGSLLVQALQAEVLRAAKTTKAYQRSRGSVSEDISQRKAQKTEALESKLESMRADLKRKFRSPEKPPARKLRSPEKPPRRKSENVELKSRRSKESRWSNESEESTESFRWGEKTKTADKSRGSTESKKKADKSQRSTASKWRDELSPSPVSSWEYQPARDVEQYHPMDVEQYHPRDVYPRDVEHIMRLWPRQGTAPGTSKTRRNDWLCPSCGNYNWATRGFCNKKDPPCDQVRDWDFNAMRGDWYCWCGNFNKHFWKVCNRDSCDGTVADRQLPFIS